VFVLLGWDGMGWIGAVGMERMDSMGWDGIGVVCLYIRR
jgi:hypothetical protein